MTYAASEACMSDTPPDRDEASAAPEAPRNPWVGWLVWAILVPVLYVMSSGPVFWLVEKHHLPEQAVAIYIPLLGLSGEPDRLLQSYWNWWVP